MQRAFVVFTLCLTIVACSRTQLAYDNADWLLERYAAKTIDISADQRAQWQPVLTQALEQHRRVELPHIIAYLDLASDLIGQTDTPSGAACLLDGALSIARRHARLAVDLTVPLLAVLNESQIIHLREYTNQRQQELVERYLEPDPEVRRSNREERFSERVESWIGPMNAEQRQLVVDALGRIPDLTPTWLAYRERQSERLLDILESDANHESLGLHLNGWWVNWQDRSPEYQRQWHIARLEFAAFLTELAPTLTEKQLGKLRKRLGKLRTELATLLPADHTRVEQVAADSICPFAPA